MWILVTEVNVIVSRSSQDGVLVAEAEGFKAALHWLCSHTFSVLLGQTVWVIETWQKNFVPAGRETGKFQNSLRETGKIFSAWSK